MNKKILILMMVILSILSITSVFGLSFTGETTGQWTQYGFDRFSSNAYVYFTGSYNADIDNGTNFTYTDNEASGGDFQPIAFDWDSDGVVEIIAPAGTTLNVYDPSSNTLVLEESYNMGGTMGTQGWCGTDATLGKYCVFNMGSNLVTLSYDGTTISTLGSTSLGAVTIGSAINCHSDAEYSIPYCFAVVDNTTESEIYLAQFRADTDDDLSFTRTGVSSDLAPTPQASMPKPVITDFDYDGELEVIWMAKEGAAGYVHVEAWNSTSNSLTGDTSFSADGYLAIHDVLHSWGGFVVYDVDGATDEEICSLARRGDQIDLKCVNSDGTEFDSVVVEITNDEASVGLAFGDVDGDIVQDFVVLEKKSSSLYVKVYSGSSGSLVAKSSFSLGAVADYTLTPTLAKVNDDNYFDLIYGNKVMYFNSSGEVYANDTKNMVQGEHVVPVEFNQDATMDFVGQKFNSLSLYTNALGGGTAPTTITLNTLKANSGFYGYYPVACLNTETKFRAKECVSGAFDSTCTYVNTNTIATERIYTDCGGLAAVTGDYDSLNPDVNCSWTNIGTYPVNLYMQDVASAASYAVYDTISIEVINGVSGSTCDVPADYITSPSTIPTANTTDTTLTTDGSTPDGIMNTIFNGSSAWSLIGAIILILGIWSTIMGMANKYNVEMGVIGHVMGVFLGVVTATFFGLITPFVLISILIFVVCVVILKLFGKGGS